MIDNRSLGLSLIHFETRWLIALRIRFVDLERGFEHRNQLRYFLFVFIEIPQPNLLLVSHNKFIIEIIKHHVSFRIAFELECALFCHQVVLVDLATDR